MQALLSPNFIIIHLASNHKAKGVPYVSSLKVICRWVMLGWIGQKDSQEFQPAEMDQRAFRNHHALSFQ
jgi:hypothetical protein